MDKTDPSTRGTERAAAWGQFGETGVDMKWTCGTTDTCFQKFENEVLRMLQHKMGRGSGSILAQMKYLSRCSWEEMTLENMKSRP